VVGLADVVHNGPITNKRADKMADRTAVWMRDTLAARTELEDPKDQLKYALFAPILPIAKELQSWYLNQLVDEDTLKHVSGLAMYGTQLLETMPEQLGQLPRLAMTEPNSPNRLLYEISQGMDLFAVPFIGAATDAGIVLDFSFPPSVAADGKAEPRALGIDMWSSTHATDLSPLTKGCDCYACKKHHRAFLQHLLSAKEMLGWVLLQIHNHRIMDDFFASVRKSIQQGTFDADRQAFERFYESELPEKTGQGPRYAPVADWLKVQNGLIRLLGCEATNTSQKVVASQRRTPLPTECWMRERRRWLRRQ